MTAAQSPIVSEADIFARYAKLMRGGFVQIIAVCDDNAPESCNKAVALKSVREVAIQSLNAIVPSSPIAKVRTENTTAPEGWKLVPVEITPPMAEAFEEVSRCDRPLNELYKAMLAAAPSPTINRDGLDEGWQPIETRPDDKPGKYPIQICGGGYSDTAIALHPDDVWDATHWRPLSPPRAALSAHQSKGGAT